MPRFARPAAVLAGSVAILVAGATAASAHHCYIGTKSLNGPKSANWIHLTVPAAAADPEIAGFVAECPAAEKAGLAALKDQGLPLSIKIFEKKTIGEGSNNPNLDNGKGLEHFGAGSTLAFDALGTYIAVASSTSCD
jgi:hypothetical protein